MSSNLMYCCILAFIVALSLDVAAAQNDEGKEDEVKPDEKGSTKDTETNGNKTGMPTKMSPMPEGTNDGMPPKGSMATKGDVDTEAPDVAETEKDPGQKPKTTEKPKKGTTKSGAPPMMIHAQGIAAKVVVFNMAAYIQMWLKNKV